MLRGHGSAATMWAGTDVRRRWRSLIVLGLLVGVTGGVAVAALVGSFQNRQALDAVRERTNAPDLTVFTSQRGLLDPDWDPLRTIPEVEQLGVWHLLFGDVEGDPGGVLFGPGDGYLTDMNQPIVIDGRMWDPTSYDEIVVSEEIGTEYPVGSTITFRSMGPADAETFETISGPTQRLTVVGVIRTVNQFVFTEQAWVSPGYMTHYADEIITLENADLDLRDPVGDVAGVQRAVNEQIQVGVPVFDLNVAARRVETTLGVEAMALLMLAAVIAVVGGLLVAQAVGRSVVSIEDDAQALQAMGMTNTDITWSATLVHLVMIAVAGITMFVVAVAISPIFPVGLGRDIHPDVGIHIAWRWLMPAIALTIVVTLGGVALIAYLATVRRTRQRPSSVPGVVRSLRRLPWVSVGLGTTMAFDAGRGQRRIPVRAALVASTLGIAGVIGTLMIDHGIDETLANPERAGQISDVDVYPTSVDSAEAPFDPEWVDRVMTAAGASAAGSKFGRFATSIDDVGGVATTVEPASSDHPTIALTITHGRAPESTGEVAVGPKTAEDLGVGIGDELTLDEIDTKVRIVGIALFPPEVHGGFDEGLWLTPPDFYRTAAAGTSEVDLEQWLGVTADGDPAATAERINAELATDGSGQAGVVDPPLELANLENVQRLPLLLAAFLALLAIVSLSHVLATTIRRRKHDFAILRALGLQVRPTRLILNAQGTSIAVFGLLVGIPLGILIGRQGWRWVADATSIEYAPPLAVIAVAVSIPAAILIVNALALWPGQRLARMRLAEQLRTE